VRTVEHLLAALACSGVDDARIEIDGPEVPLLDGSAQVWVEAIQAVGCRGRRAGEGEPCFSDGASVQTGTESRAKEGKEDTGTSEPLVTKDT
jgi:UDP-3-O-[3-hydroxymyristoyl] N-acetylglucosamine deacetylase